MYVYYICSWHDAGTYDAKTKTGGPDGSIRNEHELKHSANNGLKIAVDFCGEFSFLLFYFTGIYLFIFSALTRFFFKLRTEEVKAKHPKITFADLYQVI